MERVSEKLPVEFLNRLKIDLGNDYEKYLSAIDERMVRGLRVNTKKIDLEHFKELFDEPIENIPYAKDCFVLNSDEKLGNSPLHLSGAFYLQEPSSMIAVLSSGLDKESRPVKVLDLCASPGGKSGQIASIISNDSLLVSNEIISSRASVLFSNIERQGFKNVIVINEKPENLGCFAGFFDYVFVDAPCSGEGMFRKTPETIEEWSAKNVEMCKTRQMEILKNVQALVAENGKLIYSTCTFSKSEDEEVAIWFEDNFDFHLIDVPDDIKKVTVSAKTKNNQGYARKFYPFSGKGEGQFVAVFERFGSAPEKRLHTKKHFRSIEYAGRMKRKPFDEFVKNNLTEKIEGNIYEVGDNLFLTPSSFSSDLQTAFDSLKFLSLGVKLGAVNSDRFEPNHSLFMAFGDAFKVKIELSDDEVKKYLHGEELIINGQNFKGYGVVTKNGLALGGVKIVANKLKNLYPKGLRI